MTPVALAQRIKVVPNDTPNADGIWIELPADSVAGAAWTKARRVQWRRTAEIFASHVPDGMHLVRVEMEEEPTP